MGALAQSVHLLDDDDESFEPAPAPFPYRVFGIGLNKTGTSSLARALRHLGVVPVASQKLVQQAGLIEAVMERGDYEPALRYARLYRAFEDRPWNLWDMYRRLDERYPGSRFVLTRRHPASWWRSVERWITVSKPGIGERYRRHLRAKSLAPDDMVAAYLAHEREVREWFRGRSEYLELDFEAGDGWPQLCGLLDLPLPERSFPHANRQRYDLLDRKLQRQRGRRHRPARLQGVGKVLGPRSCVACGDELPRGGQGEEARGLIARLPARVKALYRALQRRAFVPAGEARESAARVEALRRRHPGLSLDGMAVVCCFFNPCGYRSRLDNYRRFRAALAASGLPVLTVELAVGDDTFQLGPEAGEVLRLRSPHAMWQKERLLNLGIRRLLARGADRVVWLDADVVFEDAAAWPWHVAAALEERSLCQVFGQVVVEQEGGRALLPGVAAVRYGQETGSWLFQDRRGPTPSWPLGYPLGYSGFGWAARAEVLSRVELYDRAIVGGGDKLIYAASIDLGERWRERAAKLLASAVRACAGCGHVNRAPRYLEDYLSWAERWRLAVGGEPGWTDRSVRSLYHGDRRDRQYTLRRDILLRHEFDPAADLAEGPDGTWRWASAKPDLHLEVQNYFFERREDG